MDTELLDVSDTDQLRALGHPARMRLLLSVGADGATVSQLATRLGTNKGNVAHHLAVLEKAGLVRRGRTRTVRGGTEQYFERVARRIRTPGGAASGHTAAMLADRRRGGRRGSRRPAAAPPAAADDPARRPRPWARTSTGSSPTCRRGGASDPLHSVLVGALPVDHPGLSRPAGKTRWRMSVPPHMLER